MVKEELQITSPFSSRYPLKELQITPPFSSWYPLKGHRFFKKPAALTIRLISHQLFTCTKSVTETVKNGVKYVLKLTIKTQQLRHQRRSGFFIVNF